MKKSARKSLCETFDALNEERRQDILSRFQRTMDDKRKSMALSFRPELSAPLGQLRQVSLPDIRKDIFGLTTVDMAGQGEMGQQEVVRVERNWSAALLVSVDKYISILGGLLGVYADVPKLGNVRVENLWLPHGAANRDAYAALQQSVVSAEAADTLQMREKLRIRMKDLPDKDREAVFSYLQSVARDKKNATAPQDKQAVAVQVSNMPLPSLRDAFNMTVADVAGISGITARGIRLLEAESASVNTANLKKYVEALRGQLYLVAHFSGVESVALAPSMHPVRPRRG